MKKAPGMTKPRNLNKRRLTLVGILVMLLALILFSGYLSSLLVFNKELDMRRCNRYFYSL